MVVSALSSCVLPVTKFDVAAQRRPIADKAVNQHMVIVILVLRIGRPGATQPDTRIRFHGSAYG